MRPVKDTHMVLVVGPAGSGKTTVARERFPGYTLFDNDRIIEAVWGALQFHPEVKHTAKAMTAAGVERALRHGLAVVVPISGRTRQERARWLDLARAAGYRVTALKVAPPADVCLERCKADPSRPKSTDWQPIIERWFRIFEPIVGDEADEYLEVDS
ncbi:MAG: ATP-binding protein [Sedimentisphaerales bacterium]|nr:ATP-binding protein [Sedimentisphaerales bacterium]